MLPTYIRVPVLVAVLTAFVFAPSSRLHAGQPRRTVEALPLAYEAVFPNRFNTTTTILYDRGKYAIHRLDRWRLYDGSQPPLRWTVDLKTKMAFLDDFEVLRRLDANIRAQGVSRVARTTGLKPKTLKRFHRGFGTWQYPVFDHLLEKASARKLAGMQPTGTELVAGWRCVVYVDKQSLKSRKWVEPSTGLILRRQDIAPSGNPRITSSVVDWHVLKFSIARRLDQSNFTLPRGVTAELPRLFADLPLPKGVKRELLSDDHSMLGSGADSHLSRM